MDNKEIIMKCGHKQIGITKDNKPYCLICDCHEVENKQIDLKNREAKCIYCGYKEKSSFNLPFFNIKKIMNVIVFIVDVEVGTNGNNKRKLLFKRNR